MLCTVLSFNGAELANSKRMRDGEVDGYKSQGILEYDKIKVIEMNENFRREYPRGTKAKYNK